MIILLAALFIIGVILAIYGLSVADSSPAKKKKKIFRESKVIQEIKPDSIDKQDESEILKKELEDLRKNYLEAQNELELLRKKDSEYAQELTRREEWVEKAQALANKAKEESLDLERKFIAKEKDLEVEFSKNVDLSRQLREISMKISTIEKDNSGLSGIVHSQKMQIEKFMKDSAQSVKQVQDHINTINEMKKKTEQSEWISKVDFNKLNDEYSQLEKELEKKEEQIKILITELNNLKPSGNNEPEEPISDNEIKPDNTVEGSDVKKEEGNV